MYYSIRSNHPARGKMIFFHFFLFFLTLLKMGIWYNTHKGKEKRAMAIPYTYWQDADGWFVGYWSDYPDHSTQGRTLDELKYMLISLRKDICEMIADGTWTDAPRSVGQLEFA